MPVDRLFVPLTAFCFEQFSCGKIVEVRRRRGQWLPKHVRVGRRVELRRGYSGPARWATVTAVFEARNINDLLVQVPYRKIFPYATTWSEAERMACHEFSVLSHKEGLPLVAFELKLD
jgi:hypothetical protein